MPYIRYEWKLTYLDESEYRVYGDTCIRMIELYRGSPHTLTYMAGIYNGTAQAWLGDARQYDWSTEYVSVKAAGKRKAGA